MGSVVCGLDRGGGVVRFNQARSPKPVKCSVPARIPVDQFERTPGPAAASIDRYGTGEDPPVPKAWKNTCGWADRRTTVGARRSRTRFKPRLAKPSWRCAPRSSSCLHPTPAFNLRAPPTQPSPHPRSPPRHRIRKPRPGDLDGLPAFLRRWHASCQHAPQRQQRQRHRLRF